MPLQNPFPGQGFGAFWASGPLASLEQACLASIQRRGYHLTLFSYDPISNVPEGITTAHAEEIVTRKMLNRIIYNGKPDLTHFSDLFRYELIAQRDLIYVDTDLLMIGEAKELPHPNIFVQEEQGGFNNAILYFANQEVSNYVLQQVTCKFDKELRWGETGPEVVKSVVENITPRLETYSHQFFYPIEHYEIWKILLPDYSEECASKCSNAITLHVFNNIFTTISYWKELAPPEGSYLHYALDQMELLCFFKDTYPRKIMEGMVANYRFRQNGQALGIKTVIKQVIPSIGRTLRHYRK